MDAMIAVFTILGAVANIVVAIVAIPALNTWRKQIAGASHHELAKKLSGVLRQIAIARDDTLRHLERFSEKANPMRSISERSLSEAARHLDDAVSAVGALEGQAHVLWGETMFKIVDVIRKESATLVQHVDAELSPSSESWSARIAYCSPDIAPTFTLGAYKRALDELTELAQDWLGQHVGRENAKIMRTDELSARRQRLTDEFAQRASAEQRRFEALGLDEMVDDDAESSQVEPSSPVTSTRQPITPLGTAAIPADTEDVHHRDRRRKEAETE